MLYAKYQEAGLCSSQEKCDRNYRWANFPMSKIFKVSSNRKWTCCRSKTALHDTVLHTDALCQISGSWPLWFPRKMWQKLSCEQICLCPQYSKSRQTGSKHAADSKMCYTIQFSILMLCAKYQEAGLCGSREKCDRRWRRKTTEVIPICRLR